MPWENMKNLACFGVVVMGVADEYGCLGLPVLDFAIVLEEIAKVCYVTAMAVMSAMGVQNRVIATSAPQPIKETILPGVCTGKVVLALSTTEPHAGTEVANSRTHTQVHTDRYLLNGTTQPTRRPPEAQRFVCLTPT